MPIPANTCRIVIGGSLQGGARWATGWWQVYSGSEDAQKYAQDTASDIAAAASQPTRGFDGLQPYMAQTTHIDKVSTYVYTNSQSATGIGEASVSGWTGQGNMSNPNQLALVVTLLTGAPGRSNRGRMYIPANGIQPGNGQISRDQCTALAQAVDTMIGQTGIVVSQVRGTYRPVTSFRVDSRFDIQRDRAKHQVVAASSTVQATPG